QVQHRLALIDADRHRGDHLLERLALQCATFLQHFQRIDQRHHRTGDGRGTGATIGLDHVAVDVQGVLAQLAHVQRGAQRAADQALDFQSTTALLATAGFTLVTLAGSTRQHAVLGGQPALPLPLEKARYAGFDTDGADHLDITELDQYRALGMLGVVAGDANRAQLIGGAATGTFHRAIPTSLSENSTHYRGRSTAGTRRIG